MDGNNTKVAKHYAAAVAQTGVRFWGITWYIRGFRSTVGSAHIKVCKIGQEGEEGAGT